MHSSAGNFDIARTLLERFLIKNPNSVEALAAIGYVSIEQGRFEDAEVALKKAITLDGGDIASLFDYARLAVKQKNYAEAVARLEKVVALNRVNPQVHYQLFLAYSRLKLTDKANTALAEFKRLDALEKQATQERIMDEKLRAQKLLGQSP
ncbi:MAG TPA: tetratricopeptide repeat protein [Pyrinomonadaceae bacterium]|nr:tetratricopeptide repeat protein [Pyrinomonadaceae bacterium]